MNSGDSEQHKAFLLLAIKLAEEAAKNGINGPFGAVIVKNGKIISEASNLVTDTNDPTAHAEVVAIRKACSVLNSYQLEGCTIYSSCEPCPMCFGAIYWARPDAVYYAATRNDAANAGFDDALIYDELNQKPEVREIPMYHVHLEKAQSVFETWLANPAKKIY